MSDDEFDAACREMGQSSKGMFQLKKLLTAYCDLAVKVGRPGSTEQCQAVLSEMESQRHKKKDDRRQSKIMSAVGISNAFASSIAPSAPGSVAPSEDGA